MQKIAGSVSFLTTYGAHTKHYCHSNGAPRTMSDLLSYLRWRIITGLAIMLLSAVIMGVTGVGFKLRQAEAMEGDREQASRLREQYEAEREIRRARQTGGYDPSDPAMVRDGYSSSEESRYSSGIEPYGNNPSE